MSLPRYPEYKDSGVDWLGEVPGHWEITRLQDVAEVLNGYPFDARLFDTNGTYPLIRIRDLNASETATRYNGEFVDVAAVTTADVLIGMDGDFNVGRWLADTPALLNQRMCCIRAESSDLLTLLRYALPTPLQAINDVTYATTVKHLSSFQVQKIRLAIPTDKRELFAIATFLDRETTKIDGLIAEQEKLIALLAEKRQATISHAVTKGLNPDAPMKDSGVAWLGDVPAHWRVMRVKHLVESADGIQMGPFGGMLLNLLTENSGYKVYGQENTISGDFSLGSRWVAESRFSELKKYQLRVGDLVLTRKGSLGNARLISLLPQPGIADSDTIRIRVNKNFILPPMFALLLHEVEYVASQIAVTKRGAILSGLNSENIANLTIACPPLSEQESLLEVLLVQRKHFDDCVEQSSKAITLLKERRSALISAAVTGKIDVRHLAEQEAA